MRIESFDPPAPKPEPAQHSGANGRCAARLVIRTLRPAVEVEVMCSRGGPEFVRGPNIAARVVSTAGPWRRDGEWWKTDSPAAAESICKSDIPRIGEGVSGEETDRNFECASLRSALDKDPHRTSPYQGEDSKERAGAQRAGGFIRDYYELALDDGGVYRVFRSVGTEQWFVDGVYD
jgi:hypothetical protein